MLCRFVYFGVEDRRGGPWNREEMYFKRVRVNFCSKNDTFRYGTYPFFEGEFYINKKAKS